jgi:hypothetical protein
MDSVTDNKIKKNHTFTLNNKITVTGVVNIISMGEKEVEIALSNNVLVLYGNGFSALHLSIEEGVLVLSGELISMKYAHSVSKEGFLKRMLK